MKIPIYHWGGSPIRVFASGIEIQASDRATFKAWAGRLSDPANARDEWLSWVKKGWVWFEGSSNNHQNRLLLRPFYQDSGVRPQWAFCGFVFPISAGEPAVWAAILRRLLEAREDDLMPSDGNLIIGEIVPWKVIKECSFPTGQVFDGSYSDALGHLCDSIASCTWIDFEGLHIACHPPVAFPSVNSLVLSENFPIKNIRIVPGRPEPVDRRETAKQIPPLQISPAIPTPPPTSGSPQKKRSVSAFRLLPRHPLLILFAGIAAGALGGWVTGNSRVIKKDIEIAKRDAEKVKLHQQLSKIEVEKEMEIAKRDAEKVKLHQQLNKIEVEKEMEIAKRDVEIERLKDDLKAAAARNNTITPGKNKNDKSINDQ